MRRATCCPLLVILSTLVPLSGLAADGDAALVAVRTDGSTTQLKAGERGHLHLALLAAPGAHVNREAPVKVQLSSRQATFDRPGLTLSDARLEGDGARFEVGFTPTAQGPISVEASLSFYACTATTCAKQSRTVSVAVDVR
jgi:hypothetical protein